jgi:hypothetical protein
MTSRQSPLLKPTTPYARRTRRLMDFAERNRALTTILHLSPFPWSLRSYSGRSTRSACASGFAWKHVEMSPQAKENPYPLSFARAVQHPVCHWRTPQLPEYPQRSAHRKSISIYHQSVDTATVTAGVEQLGVFVVACRDTLTLTWAHRLLHDSRHQFLKTKECFNI